MASHGYAKSAPAHGIREPMAKDKMPAMKFHHMEIHPGENGGAMVQHYHSSGGFSHEMHGGPHLFGPEDGKELAAHISKHIGIPMGVSNSETDKE
jgi:hypothetical protein